MSTSPRVLRLVVSLLWAALPLSAGATTFVPPEPIGTSLDDVFTIDTQVDDVTYEGPYLVTVEGYGEAWEITGTVYGTGWGGVGVPRGANAHYAYAVPFVARWPVHGRPNTLVTYHHGGARLQAALVRDRVDGAANPLRFGELLGDPAAGLPALVQKCAYVSVNRWGLDREGDFIATYLPSEVAPLTAAEAAAFGRADTVAGDPVPVSIGVDAPTFRDVGRALEELTESILGRPFHTRIGSGSSAGARLLSYLDFGVSVIGVSGVRTGGNFVEPYVADSEPIYDGFLLLGWPYDYVAPLDNADDEFPIVAPTFFIVGQADERQQSSIQIMDELLRKGASLEDQVWTWEVKNLPHIPRDSTEVPVSQRGGDTLGAFVSAAFGHMRALLQDGAEPPLSRIDGRIVGGLLVVDQANGGLATSAPVANDPTIDTVILPAADIIVRPFGAAETARWIAVTDALPHVDEAITGPSIACRLGGYKIRFRGVELVPFAPGVLDSLYGGFGGYRDCVSEVVDDLDAQGLYDPRIESAKKISDRAAHLFPPTQPKPNGK